MDDSMFDRTVLDAVDEALSIMGDNVKKSIYYFLEADLGLGYNRIPSDLKKFHDGLHLLFGAGANILESHVRTCLKRKLAVSFPNESDLDFVEFVVRLREICRG